MSTEYLLKDGDVFELCKGDKVYVELPAHLWPKNISRGDGSKSQVCDWTMMTCEVYAGDELRHGTADFLLGQYVVVKTELKGGGTGHGPSDVYPNGHYVRAQHVDHHNLFIGFYQSGCFTCMLNKTPIGRAEATWRVNKPAH